ncbi:MAG: SPASM domain-containing protein, partial [Candidatus Aenigmarchaeota archaeon]|nr:SPASM domain-containing protein [Candidatus Aenigmarchaeota archaeon]
AAMTEEKLFADIDFGTARGPKKVIISPTDWCNLKCLTCWRLDKKENPNSYRDEELTFDEISGILHDCKKLRVKEIDLTGGGEPFSREDMLDIITLAKELGFWVTLTNNGTLLSEEKMRTLIFFGLDDITFSFDGSTAELNDSIRGRGVYQKVAESLSHLQELKRELGSDIPFIRLAFVITSGNYHDIPAIVRFAAEHGIGAIQFSTLLEWDSNREFSMKNCDEQDALNALKQGAQLAEELGIYTNLSSSMKHGFFEHQLPKFCFAPWELLFINSRGQVLACCILASFYENVLGNVRDTPLEDLWNSEKMREFRKRLVVGKFYKGCERCLPDFVDRFDGLEERRQCYISQMAGMGSEAWR